MIEYNISRLRYQMALYDMPFEELLDMLNQKRKRHYTKEDIGEHEIDIRILKNIDKIFTKGLFYYVDSTELPAREELSVFFRKTDIASNLNIRARKVVNRIEETKQYLSGLARLAGYRLERKLGTYGISNDPRIAAQHTRTTLGSMFEGTPKKLLVDLIAQLASANVLVFEFVDPPSLTIKANIDGAYLKPNVIVLKKQSKSPRRELFTLAHELGHHILDEEGVERVDFVHMADRQSPISVVEKWCNDFAFFFLAGTYSNELDNLSDATRENNYHQQIIRHVSDKTGLSRLSLYTHLLLTNRITYPVYARIKAEMEEEYRMREENDKRERELKREMGIKEFARAPKPINSPLTIDILRVAYHEGMIGEAEFGRMLDVKRPDRLLE